jgi:methylmalonyl-CoA/ethylmalonyl-CoA epimerase
LLFKAPPGLAFFDCGGVRLMLEGRDKPEFDHPSSTLYFVVPDIQAGYGKLKWRSAF